MKYYKNSIYEKQVENILSFDLKYSKYSDNELKLAFQNLRRKNCTNNETILKSFAIVREVSSRALGLKHYPTQILGGLLLNLGQIVEMKTGEGKTLVATLPASFNALEGKGVHIITVNEYLAKRDATMMRKIYSKLGLTTGLIEEKLNIEGRKKNYNKDITYSTNNELGFDFLRDNCAKDLNEVVLRPFNYCIIDEVDSVLIDEARTPLIIADKKNVDLFKYEEAHFIASCMMPGTDFSLDFKLSQVSLTDIGIKKLEVLLEVNDLFDQNNPWIPYIINALKANYLFQKNKEYVVLKDKVCIVDEFTGRVMLDRRWSGGLHQAIEAKENTVIQASTVTLASITYQNFFIQYPKISGMTGTAKTSESEFQKIYNLSVSVLPTIKDPKRTDFPDFIYKNELCKWSAVAKECLLNYRLGRPVLVGTTSVKNSEILSEMLIELKIPHQLLNARPENIRREAEIIAQAGRKGYITIATNMAGRGTDIILGGNLKYLITKKIWGIFIEKSYSFATFPNSQLKYLFEKILEKLESSTYTLNQIEKEILTLPEIQNSIISEILLEIYNIIYKEFYPLWLQENEKVRELGGLYVIGTERHESLRIDNQLRGRAGRQGDPGSSRFFLSLEDELLKNFGGARISNMMNQLNLEDDQPLESGLLTKSVTQAQQKVELFYYEARKRLFEYDQVLNLHREYIFNERKKILNFNSFSPLGIQYSENFFTNVFWKYKQEFLFSDFALQEFLRYDFSSQIISEKFIQIFHSWFFEQIWICHELDKLILNTYLGVSNQYQRKNLLFSLDNAWVEHLENMEILRDSIGWKGYEQRDPLFIYKEESYKLFLDMIEKIQYNTVCNHYLLLKL